MADGRTSSSSSSSSSSSYFSAMSENERGSAVSNTSPGALRICPHQELSFERFHKIANLPNIKQAEGLDALVKLPKNHSFEGTISKPFLKIKSLMGDQRLAAYHPTIGQRRECYMKSGEEGVQFVGDASFYYESSMNMGTPGNFVLRVNWGCLMARFLFKDKKSKKGLSERLERSTIWLCPHMRLDHPWLVETMWGLMHPSDDPVDKYQAEQCADPETRCEHCRTTVRVLFEKSRIRPSVWFLTRRYLGEGQSSEDPSWRAQCGLP